VVLPSAIAVVLLVGLIALLTGCGSTTSYSPSSRELALQRSQFVKVSDELRGLEHAVQRELSSSRKAWPTIANGLPQTFEAGLREAVKQATTSAAALPEPPFAAKADVLTGPAAGIAGLYESYSRLTERGWRLTETGIAAIRANNPATANFERANSSLYIDAIYDAHFNLSLLGKSLISGYERLGGPRAFGATLTQNELNALATAYSIPAVRLEPHPGRAVQDA
jgi:hypothetical protein